MGLSFATNGMTAERARASQARQHAGSGYRPGRRVVISWSSQPLPSGSLNEANDP